MRERHILVVDNRKPYLENCADLFCQELKVKVSTASSLEEATWALENLWFDLAILDLCLVKDGSIFDNSGYRLGKKYQSLMPIIVNSRYDNVVRKQIVDEAGEWGRAQPNLVWVSKKDGEAVLLTSVRNALDLLKRWNPDLEIRYSHSILSGPGQLLGWLDPRLQEDVISM